MSLPFVRSTCASISLSISNAPWLIAVCALAWSTAPANAQAVYGSISGTVKDNYGRGVAWRDGHGHQRGARHH